MKFILHILLFTFIIPYNVLADGEPKKDTTRLKVEATTISQEHMSVTKAQLVHLVDSLLDMETIEEKEIELISYYNSVLSSKEANLTIVKYGNMPATNYYDDFDESTVFQIIPETEFPESQIIKIESDSLGIYAHPRVGPVNSKFGWRDGRMHKGIDINLHKGDAVVAAFDGMVRIAHAKGAYGNVVIIRHYNGLETVYAHLSKIKVKPGQVVLAGQLIGLGGSTGRSSGPHLHFEVRFKGQALNPSSIISFTENKTLNDSIVIKKSRYGICAYPSNATLHTIERGDTWYEVAKRYGLSMKELCLLNGTDKRYYLKIGQKLRVN
ncbi:MAG: peptidoglycan DD-metalloendopeptidase family protein [Bacteroidetes bacterium]|nr:peptidoglycan DD-metalloendopeptidase family protein [Bacteroidota bacterium]